MTEKIKKYVFFMDVAGTRRIGVPVTINTKGYTGWFRIMDGARTSFTIKRHFTKHHVEIKEIPR